MPSLQNIPLEIASLVCECLSRPDLRNTRLVNRELNTAAQRVLFRTIFVKVNRPSFDRLSNISQHTTLRHYVEAIIYDGREVEWPENRNFEGWLRERAVEGIGVPSDKREEFLARFSEEQLRNYFSSYCEYMQFVQGPVLEGDNEMKWLREAAGQFPRLSTIEYAETELDQQDGRELEPMSLFSPLAQQILVEPQMGWGLWDKHFWILVMSMFSIQCHPKVTELRGEMIDHEDMAKWNQIIHRLDMRNLQLLSLEFVYINSSSPAPNRAINSFLMRAPNLRSLQLHLWDYPAIHPNPADFPRTGLFEYRLQWKHLRELSLSHMVLSPLRLQQLLQRHSQTLRSLELSHMTLHHGSDTVSGGARALWISMIMFLSQSMSLKHVNFSGYFTTDTNEAWSTIGRKMTNVDISPPRFEGCLLSRIEHFIIYGGPCPFTPKAPKTLSDLDIDSSHDVRSWIPEHSWTWQEDDTWIFASFWLSHND